MKHKLLVLLSIWMLAVGFGLHSLMAYKGKAGSAGQSPAFWPTNEVVSFSAAKPLLLLFAHPRCPCSRASFGQLEILAAQAKGRFETAVVFYQPTNASQAWSETALVHTALAIPGVRVFFDPQGKLARRFGAETSGHALLYGSEGKLLFSGGITAARGHLGASAGFDAVLKIIRDNHPSPARLTTPVFGCSLFDPCATQTAQRN